MQQLQEVQAMQALVAVLVMQVRLHDPTQYQSERVGLPARRVDQQFEIVWISREAERLEQPSEQQAVVHPVQAVALAVQMSSCCPVLAVCSPNLD
jgi:hypothetical protein